MKKVKRRLNRFGPALLLVSCMGVGQTAKAQHLPPGQAFTPQTRPGQVIITVQLGTTVAQLQDLVKLVNGVGFKDLGFNAYRIDLADDKKTVQATGDAIAQLKMQPQVRNAIPNYLMARLQSTSTPITPNDPLFKQQWALQNINAPLAWTITKGAGSANQEIAIIDYSGFNPNHEDMKNIYDPASRDFIKNPNGGDPNIEGADDTIDNQHGGWCASIMAANTDNKTGVAGINWSTKVLAANGGAVDGTISGYSLVLSKIQTLDIKVLSLSIGYPDSAISPNDPTLPDYAATKAISDAGVLICAAAGEDVRDTRVPSGYPWVVRVSALDKTQHIASYTIHGAATLPMEMTAPGGDGDGSGTDFANDVVGTVGRTTQYQAYAGTSAATPHCAGVAAMLMSIPGVNAATARQALHDGANHVVTGQGGVPDQTYGYGALDAYQSLLRISVRVAVESPDGINPATGQSSTGSSLPPIPIETLKPQFRFGVGRVPLSAVNIQFVHQDGSIEDIIKSGVLVSSKVPSNSFSVVGTTTGTNAQFEIYFRYVFDANSPAQQITAKITATNPVSGITSSDSRTISIAPFNIQPGISMISVPYQETPADSPTGAYREFNQILSPDVTLYRWVSTSSVVNGVKTVQGRYAQNGKLGTTTDGTKYAKFQPDDITTTFDNPPSISSNDARPLGLGYFINAPASIPVRTYGLTYINTAVLVPLHEGWNMVGNPYPFPVAFGTTVYQTLNGTRYTSSEAVDQKLILPYIYRLVGTDYQFQALPNGSFEAWEGSWIYVIPSKTQAPSQTPLTLIISPTQTAGQDGARAARNSGSRSVSPAASPIVGGPGSWTLRLVASAGTLQDSYNFIGVSSKATSGNDVTKAPKPPKLSPYVSLGIIRDDLPAGQYAQDLRPIGGVHQWNITVDTDKPNEDVMVKWPDVNGVPRNYDLTLTDKTTGKSVDMRNQSQFVFNSGANAGTRAFVLEAHPSAGRSRVLISSVVINPGRPDGRGIAPFEVTYTVSADATVEATVLGLNGRTIATASPTRAANAGDNRFVWSGIDSKGNPLPSGAYVLQLRAIGKDGSSVKTVRPLIVPSR